MLQTVLKTGFSMKDDGVTKDDGVFPPSFFLSFLFLCSFSVHFGLRVVHMWRPPHMLLLLQYIACGSYVAYCPVCGG
jgi:hypothetical protein